jgi:hypothetical protein
MGARDPGNRHVHWFLDVDQDEREPGRTKGREPGDRLLREEDKGTVDRCLRKLPHKLGLANGVVLHIRKERACCRPQ